MLRASLKTASFFAAAILAARVLELLHIRAVSWHRLKNKQELID